MIHRKNGVKMFCAPMLIGSLFALTACGDLPTSGDRDGSELDQITAKQYACDINPSRVAQVKARVDTMPRFLRSTGRHDNFVSRRGWDQEDFNVVYQALARLPDPYLEFLYDLHTRQGFAISPVSFGGSGIVGLTVLTSPDNVVWRPQGIYIDERRDWGQDTEGKKVTGIDFALVHEVGHAVMSYIGEFYAKKNGTERNRAVSSFNKEIYAAYSSERGDRRVRDYAQEDVGEYMPESFSSILCSKAAADVVRDLGNGDPEPGKESATYKVMAKYMAAAGYDAGQLLSSIGTVLGLGRVPADTQNRAYGFIGAAKNTTAVALCQGTVDQCKTSRASIVNFAEKTNIGDRVIFIAKEPLPLGTSPAEFVLVSVDDKNVAATRKIKISPM